MQRLRITEIFYSLQGETDTVGLPTVFVRLTGCPLRCQYCDTSYAFSGGDWRDIDSIVTEVKKYQTNYITITGGEPLAQKACPELMTRLCNEGYRVSLETSGALPVDQVDKRVVKILDIKTPGSGESARNDWSNIPCLTDQDQVKFVICDRQDYEWAVKVMTENQLNKKCCVLFSPSYDQLDANMLADWILHDQLQVRLQIQLHKYLWGDAPGR